MLRVAAQRCSSSRRPRRLRPSSSSSSHFRFQSTAESTPSSSSSSGGGGGLGRLLKTAVVATTVGAAGTIGYAYLDPAFRKKVENNVPQSKSVFHFILGTTNTPSLPSPSASGSPQVSDMKNRVFGLPQNEESKAKSAADDTASKSLMRPTPPKEETPSKPKRESATERQQKITDEERAKAQANADLEERIKNAITSAEKKLKASAESKNKTISAIHHHAKLLREAVEDHDDPKWNDVSVALDEMQYKSKIDSNDETDTRNYLDSLRKVINDGRSSPLTGHSPILTNATETLNKLTYQLEDLNGQVNQARMESRVMNEYRDLIERSRAQFAQELKSILPNIDLHAHDAKLTEEELNALIAHAHMKVEQLRRQFTEQQVREEQHIAEAIERQKAEDMRSAEERLQRELGRLQNEAEVTAERRVESSRGEWEEELRTQLRRASAAHSEHLEEVVSAQKELLELEHNRLREAAVQRERDAFHRQVNGVLARVQGIEVALDSRAAQDAENRKAKELWLACQNLLESVVHGRKAAADCETRRKPLASELMAIKEASASDPFVCAVMKSLTDEAMLEGVYTEEDLKERFRKVYRLGWRTARIGDNGGSLLQYVWSTVMATLMFDVRKAYADSDPLQTTDGSSAEDSWAVLSRARHYALERGDLLSAVRLLQLLHGEPARIARDWIRDTRTHLETRQAAELLLAHAAASSMRTVY